MKRAFQLLAILVLGFCLPTFWLQTSNFWLQTSDFQLLTSNF